MATVRTTRRNRKPTPADLPLQGGHRLAVERLPGEDRLVLLGPGGRVSLTVHVTADGPVLAFDGPALTLRTAGDLTLDAERLTLHGRQGVAITSAGELRQKAAEVDVEATTGAARVKANDEVQLLGEMVLLNCDRPQPLPGWVPPPPPRPEQTVPVEAVSGSAALAAELERSA
jgi:hypothetical protein